MASEMKEKNFVFLGFLNHPLSVELGICYRIQTHKHTDTPAHNASFQKRNNLRFIGSVKKMYEKSFKNTSLRIK